MVLMASCVGRAMTLNVLTAKKIIIFAKNAVVIRLLISTACANSAMIMEYARNVPKTRFA